MKYEIKGDTLPVVICHLEAGERMITERGSMAWMSPNMKMETSTNGGFGKAFGRMFSGEAMFQNIYTAQGGNGLIAFASSFPGSIKAFEIGPGQEYIFQKKAFLAGEPGVNISVHFHKKVASGLFGGEGFILQKVSGNGIVFAEFARWISRLCRDLRILSLAEKDYLIRLLQDRDMYGFRQCRSAVWQIH